MLEWKSRLIFLLIVAVALAVAFGGLFNLGWLVNLGW